MTESTSPRHYGSEFGLKAGAEKFPLMVVASVTYRCNSACPACPYTNSGIRRQYHDALDMPVALMDRIAEECGRYGAVLRFTGGGEPFLHHYCTEMAIRATHAGARVSIITNGSRMTSWECGPLMAANLHAIEFSVDAGTSEEYALVRPHLNWDDLAQSVLMADSMRDAYKAKTAIIASIVDQKGVDVERARRFWQEHVDKVQVRKYLTWGLQDSKANDATPYLPPEQRIPCPWLFERINIDTRGDVTYCGEDISFNHKFANIRNRTIEEIWRGPEMETAREAHLKRRGDSLVMCSRCPDWQYRSWEYNYWRLTNR